MKEQGDDDHAEREEDHQLTRRKRVSVVLPERDGESGRQRDGAAHAGPTADQHALPRGTRFLLPDLGRQKIGHVGTGENPGETSADDDEGNHQREEHEPAWGIQMADGGVDVGELQAEQHEGESVEPEEHGGPYGP